MQTVEGLIDLLTLEKVAENIFVGGNYKTPWKRVFGGQVLAQSLHAAYQTVPEDSVAHSMHAYFILAGDINEPIQYEVDLIRNGRSFTTRRVVAFQKGRAIFNMAASFQLKQEGFDHQIPMPNVLPPEVLMTDVEQVEQLRKQQPELASQLPNLTPKAIEFRPVENRFRSTEQARSPYFHVWMKTKDKLPIDLPMQHQILAYASDYNLLTAAILPHQHRTERGQVFFASLDHALWFHRDFRIDDWLLYAIDSPSASNARGFARGSIFNQAGQLVASVSQEGLMRVINER